MNKILERIELKSAEQLLKEYDVRVYPDTKDINIWELYDKIGIVVRNENFNQLEIDAGIQNIQGLAISDDVSVGIFASKKLSLQEKKEMYAHLLGHIVCKDYTEYKIQHIETKDDMSEEHKKANQFAKELLIPKKSLIDVCNKLYLPYLSALCKIYDVRPQLMKERLEELRIAYYKDMFWETKEELFGNLQAKA